MRQITLHITITEQPYQDEDNADAMLLGTCEVNGVPHHVALYPVSDNSFQEAPYEGDDDAIAHLRQFDGADGPYQTIEHDGQQYVCAITPYC